MYYISFFNFVVHLSLFLFISRCCWVKNPREIVTFIIFVYDVRQVFCLKYSTSLFSFAVIHIPPSCYNAEVLR